MKFYPNQLTFIFQVFWKRSYKVTAYLEQYKVEMKRQSLYQRFIPKHRQAILIHFSKKMAISVSFGYNLEIICAFL